jgi:hypothetical protein
MSQKWMTMSFKGVLCDARVYQVSATEVIPFQKVF